jgi:LDH2 family malate/lactate/ureidoglycolate dehydrogenase
VRLFPVYLRELDGGRACADPRLVWSRAGTAGRRLDAGGALGLVAGTIASREAAELARQHGVAAVSVGGSNHFGAASTFTIEMARAGAVGVCFSNADALTAPFGGTGPLFGTNPLSVAALGEDDELFCLDMATSQLSFSQVKARLARGEPLPAGCALRSDGGDAAGARSSDEVVALQPLGGYKGHGLAMAVGLVCALLGEMPFDHELSHFYAPPFDAGRRVSHLFVALDVASFVAPEAFRRRLSEYLAHVRSQPAVAGGAVRAPGDLEAIARRDRIARGIPLDEDVVDALREVGLVVGSKDGN